jgi:ribonuclease VapC
MILDSSAVVAMLFREQNYQLIESKILSTGNIAMGVPTLVETGIVVSARLSEDARGLIQRFVDEVGVTAIPFGESHFQIAIDGWLRFGRGRHPAALNFGDCMSYATAKLANEPLLCIGNDFAQTDIELA